MSLTPEEFQRKVRDLCNETLRVGLGVPVPIPEDIRVELEKFNRGEPNVIEQLPFSMVTSLVISLELQKAPSSGDIHSSNQRSRVPRFKPGVTGRSIDDDDFIYDAVLLVKGDFKDDDQRLSYAQWLCDKLNAP